jgi:Bacterial Ig domain
MKRIVSLMLIMMLVLNGALLNAGIAHAETGDEPSKVDSLQVTPNKVSGGETVNFNLKTSDQDIAGIILSYINGEQKKDVTLQLSNEDWKGSLKAAKEDNGNWTLSNITLTNENGNKTILPGSALADQSAINFEVEQTRNAPAASISSTENSSSMPVTVEFDKETVNAGENLTVSLSTDDTELTEVYVQLQGPSSDLNSTQDLFLQKNENGQWAKTFTLSANEEPGEWKVSHIRLRTSPTNAQEFDYNEENYPAEFKKYIVINPNYDIDPPVLTGVNFEKTTLAEGESTKVTITADDQSGISYASMSLLGPSGKEHSVYFEIGEDGLISGELNADHSMESGKWIVDYISMEDGFGRTQNYYHDDGGFPIDIPSIQIGVGETEIEPPSVTSVEFEKSSVLPNNSNNVYVNVSDYTKINSVIVEFVSPSGDQKLETYFLDLESNSLKQPINLNDAELGEWRVSNIRIIDIHDKEFSTQYSNENYPASFKKFMVVYSQTDVFSPTVKEVTFESASVEVGERNAINISVEDASEVESVMVGLISQSTKNTLFFDLYKNEIGQWTSEFNIDELTEPGTWKVDQIYVRDIADNYKNYYYSSEDYPVNFGSYNVINEGYDNQPPTVESVEFEKETVRPGDENILYIKVNDSSDIQYVHVELVSPSGSQFSYVMIGTFEPDRLSGTVYLPYDAEPGEWRVKTIYLSDTNHNEAVLHYTGDEYPVSFKTFTVENEEYDVDPPVVNKIEFSNEQVIPGETVDVYVTAEDRESGIENLYVELTNYDNLYVPIDEFVKQPDGRWKSSLTIPPFTKSSTMKVSYISVFDKTGNEFWKYYDYGSDNPYSTFNILNENQDDVPPIIKSISFSNDPVQPGDTNTVNVLVEDASPVHSVKVQLVSPSYRNYEYLDLQLTEDGTKWTGDFNIFNTSEPGTWRINSVEVRDAAYNGEIYYYSDQEYPENLSTFTIINENYDTDPPNIVSVDFEKHTMEAHEENTITLDIQDQSRVSYVAVHLTSPSGKSDRSVYFYEYEATNLSQTFTLPFNPEPGEWKVEYITAEDVNGNITNLDITEEYPNSFETFTLINEQYDGEPPVVTKVEFDKEQVNAGETVNVYVTAADTGSGIEAIYMNLSNYNGKDLYLYAFVKQTDGRWKGEVSIPSNAKYGQWYVEYIDVYDNVGNEYWKSYSYPEQNPYPSFNVINENADETPPTVKQVSFEKDSVEVGESNTVTVSVEDTSPIESVMVELISGSNKNDYSLYLDASESGTWTADFTINENMEPGTWKVSRVYVRDTEENSETYYYSNDNYPDYLSTFNVNNENYDAEPPALVSATFEKDTVQASESNTVYLDAYDQSGISFARIEIINSTGENDYIYLYDGEMSGPFTISDRAAPGEWRIKSIFIRDNNNNELSEEFSEDDYPSSLDTFNVINSNYDDEDPTVSKIELSENELNAGETLDVYVTADGTGSDISSIDVTFWNGSINLYANNFEQQTDGRWKASVYLPDYLKDARWFVSSVYLYDSYYNDHDEYYYDTSDNPHPTFSVKGNNPDITPPIVKEVVFGKETIDVLENNYLYMSIEDDWSGVDYAQVVLISPSGKHTQYVWVGYGDMEGAFVGHFSMDEFKESGLWRVSEIKVWDRNGNHKKTTYSEQDYPENFGTFYLNNETPDVLPPEIKGVQFTPNIIQAGEPVEIQVEATDNLSGVDYLNVGLVNEDGNQLDIYDFVEQDGKWVSSWTTSAYMPSGEYKVRFISAYDKTGNEYHKNSNRGDVFPEEFGTLTVENENEDVTAPEIQNVSFTTPVVNAGDQGYVKILATDDLSGISQINMGLVSPSGQTIHVHDAVQQFDNSWLASFQVTQYAEPGEWKVSYVNITDKVGNQRSYETDYLPNHFGTFTVINDNPDVNPPVIQSVSFDKDSYQSGDILRVSAKVTDDMSGVGFVHLFVGPKDDSETVWIKLNEWDGESYSGTVQIPDNPQGGEWRVYSVSMGDVATNQAHSSYYETYPETFESFQIINDSYVPKPVVYPVNKESTEVSGESHPGYEIRIYDINDRLLASGIVDEQGRFSITIAKQEPHSELKVTATNTDGKTSSPRYVYVEDLVSIDPPVVYPFSDQDTILSGTAEPYFQIYIYIGLELYIAETDENGQFSFEIGKQQAGELIQVRAEDRHGNASPVTQVIVEDKTAPGQPVVNEVGDNETVVTGTAERGSIVTVKAGDTVLGTAEAKDGIFSVTIAKQKAGTKLSITAVDTFENESAATVITVVDKTAPEKPVVNEVGDSDTTVTGTAEAGSTVAIKAGTTELATAITSETGAFSVTIVKQKAGTLLEVTATYSEDNKSEATKITVTDKTAPNKPVVNPVGDNDTKVTGTAEEGSTVTVRVDSVILGTAKATDGVFSVTIAKQKAGTKLAVTAKDAAENVSESTGVTVVDKTAPEKPEVYEVGDNDTVVTGTAESGSIVTVKAGNTVLGTAETRYNSFSVIITKQKAGTKLTLTAKDTAENVSAITEVIVKDKTAPEKPVVNEVGDSDTKVTGTAEPGSTVTVKVEGAIPLGYTTALENGEFTIVINKQYAGMRLYVSAKDAAGNVSESTVVTVVDKTAPGKPVVNSVDDNDVVVTGTAEPGSTVTVKKGLTVLGTANASGTGAFSVEIAKQSAGVKLSVIAEDSAGYTSGVTEVTVLDKTAPATPTVNTVDDNDTKVTGKAEAGSAIVVKVGTKEIGKATATTTGTFSVTIVKQKADTKLAITATDAAKNTSAAKTVTVVDKTAPATPSVNTVDDNDTKVTGKAEAGSTVTVKAGTTTLGTANTTSTGTFSVTIVKQKAGTKLSITVTDKAKNTSTAAAVTVVDKTAPVSPTVNTVDDNDVKVTGKAEAGSTVTLKAGTTTLGTATTTSTGTFSVTIVKQKAGTKLTITATDKAKNTSTASSVTVIDKTAPLTPTVNTVDDNDLKVTGKAEAGSTVTVKVGTKTLGSATATSTGTFSVTIVKQKAGTKLTVTATDKAKNTSAAKTVTVIDKTAPNAPTVNRVDNNDLKVTGKAEAGSTITVKVGTKTIGSGKVLSNGTYSIKITAQKTGTKLTVTAADLAKNVSKVTVYTVVKA